MARNGTVIVGGGDAVRLEAELEAAAPGAQVILSSGIAGAVAPGLNAGDVVIDGSDRLVEVLRRVLPDARAGIVVGSDAIVARVPEKCALYERTGALAVDMETHIAERVAARHGLPFAALRVISDAANETLPPAALVGMRPDGGMALGPVLASLARHPGQLPALIWTGLSAGRAFRSLERCHDVLRRAGIGQLDLGEFALDV
ncbi:MAG: phosphorylase [Sphingomonadales bacterium]|nr:phosphorylase [Sphingomonadales bacterium]